MIQRLIGLFVLLCTIAVQESRPISINELISKHLVMISSSQSELGDNISHLRVILKKGDIQLDLMLESDMIQKIFQVDAFVMQENISDKDSIRIVQYLALLYLYQKVFFDYIVISQNFLNNLMSVKKYWMYEDFYMKQPFWAKNILYNFYTVKYQNKITKNLDILYKIENEVAGILGFCLYGLFRLEKLKDEYEIINYIKEISDQFNLLIAPDLIDNQSLEDSYLAYKRLLVMSHNIQEHINSAQITIKQNEKNSFVVDHWFGVSCTTMAIVAAALIYTQHKQTVKSLYDQGKIAIPDFLQEYLVDPLVGIKKVVWDKETKRLEHVEPFADIQKFSDIPDKQDFQKYEGFSTLLVNPILNPFVGTLNATKSDLIQTANSWKNDIVEVLNGWKKSSEKTLNKKIDEANDTIIKNNQVNMYLATLGPVLFGTYWLGSSMNNMYDHHIKHKNWYLPMKHIIRSIDQLVNKVARSLDRHNFIDDGKLYILIQNLKEYISCLNNEELFLMHNDIEELLSFDLNYSQKKGIIDRMYKTYDFLK
ncbi:hypothetical protein HYV10_02005 [Candidatus Dependentiae bacterium]|nr:hypothetical protein [Candidatus Dependentiae bacterium]